MSNVCKTRTEIRDGKIVKVTKPLKKHGADRKQEKLNDRGSYSTAANNAIIVPIWQKITLTIEEAAAYSNIGICKLNEPAKKPNRPFVLYIGKKKLVKREKFEKHISDAIEI